MKQYQIDAILERLGELDEEILNAKTAREKSVIKLLQALLVETLEAGAFHSDFGVWTTEDRGTDRK